MSLDNILIYPPCDRALLKHTFPAFDSPGRNTNELNFSLFERGFHLLERGWNYSSFFPFLSFLSLFVINYFHARYPINFSLHSFERKHIAADYVPQVSTGWSVSISSNTMRNGRTSTSVVYGRGRQTPRYWRRIVAISAWSHPRPFIPPTSPAWSTRTGRSRPSTSPIPSPTWVGSFRWLLTILAYLSFLYWTDNNTNGNRRCNINY